MKIDHQKMTSLRLISTRNAVYKGQTMVDQFAIDEIYSVTENTNKSTRYALNIRMTRDFTNQLLTTFIPTLILWLFGYSTLFIDMADFSERFMGAGTSLLVLATQFAATSRDLPKTSYMKLIDTWFLWHNISILAIIFYHIILNKRYLYLTAQVNDEVEPFESSGGIKSTRQEHIEALHRANNIIITIFPSLHIIFCAIYFLFPLQ